MEEEEALRLAQDESLALALQQQQEEEALQAALREIEIVATEEEPSERNERKASQKETVEVKHDEDKSMECQICMEEYSIHELFYVSLIYCFGTQCLKHARVTQINACNHAFCADCMSSYITMKIKERAIAAPEDPIEQHEKTSYNLPDLYAYHHTVSAWS